MGGVEVTTTGRRSSNCQPSRRTLATPYLRPGSSPPTGVESISHPRAKLPETVGTAHLSSVQ